jgi:N-acetylneuraminic acid mutarotase
VGLGGSAEYGQKKDFWEYNPLTNTWIQKANFGGDARSNCTSFSINNKGYIGFGYTIGNTKNDNDMWEYNPATNQWLRKDDFSGIKRSDLAGFAIGGRGYIGTGNNDGFEDFREFNPE